MNARADFITLTIGFDIPSDRVLSLLRGSDTPERRRLESMISHEFRHLYSFLASPLSDLHYLIITAQVGAAHEILSKWHMGSLELQIPFGDSVGNLAPNPHSAAFAQAFSSGRNTWDVLEKLRAFLLSSGPVASEEELLEAVQVLCQCHDCLHLEGFVFMSEQLRNWVGRDFAFGDPFTGANFPVLPYWRDESSADAQKSTISSICVLEGLAILGELLQASQHSKVDGGWIRPDVPSQYTTGLRFALDCVNSAHGTAFQLSDLMAGSVPLNVMATLAAVFDLALQIPIVNVEHGFSSGRSVSGISKPTKLDTRIHLRGSLAELSPAWRLYCFGKLMKEKRIPLLESVDASDTSDFRELQICLVEDHLHWAHPDMFGTLAKGRFMDRYRDQRSPSSAVEVFDYLTSLARVMRDQNEVAYIMGRVLKTQYAFDVVGFVFPKGMFMPLLGREASGDFQSAWDRNYFRLSACLFGRYWDKWWAEWEEEEVGEVLECIRNALGAIARESADLGYADTAEQRWIAFNIINLRVREDFLWPWKVSPNSVERQTNRSPEQCADLVASFAERLAREKVPRQASSQPSHSQGSQATQRKADRGWLRSLLAKLSRAE
jgi:hypothetical protein